MRTALALASAMVVLPIFGQANVIRVSSGSDLQAAIDRARPGDTILLAAGATYVGNFVLPRKEGTTYITIRTEGDSGLPRAGQRVSPTHAPRLAKLKSPNGNPVIRTSPRAQFWRLQLLEILPTEDRTGEIVALGEGGRSQSDLSQVPQNLAVDQCYIHGDPDRGQKRGIALNSGQTQITNSYIAGMWSPGQDSQAIGGWNGPGPYRIENNYLEAASENFMLGGAEPSIEGLVPTDIVFRRNHLSKPLDWRDRRSLAVKNLFELKNARKVLVEGNLMEYSWRDGQAGFAIVLTPRGEKGRAAWATVDDVTFRYNIVRHAGGAINVLGRDDSGDSGRTRAVRVEHNVFSDIDDDRWGGSGAFLQVGLGASDITVLHNTILQSGNIVTAHGNPNDAANENQGFAFRDNIVRHNRFGVTGQGRAFGQDSLNVFFPGAQFTSNAIEGGDSRRYPSQNVFLTDGDLNRQFVDPARGDYRLQRSSRLIGSASDKRDFGVDFVKLLQILGMRMPPDTRLIP